MIDTEDPRMGLPSASAAERTFECPGWVNLSRKVSDVHLPESKDAKDGTLVHDVLAEDADEDALDGREDLLHAKRVCEERLQALVEFLGFEDPDIHLKEERMFLHGDNGDPIATGEFDRAIFKDGKLLIADFKTGRKDQIHPANNKQLLSYALLLAEEYDFDEAILAIIPAWPKMPPAAKISRANLEAVRPLYVEAFEATTQPNAPRKAGPHCDYCPARAICHQAHALVRESTTFSDTDVISPEEELRRYDVCEHATKTIKANKEYLHAKITADPDAIPGLAIGKGARTVTCVNSEAIYTEMAPLLGHEKLMTCATFRITAMASVACGGSPTTKKLTKEGEAKRAELEAMLGGALRETIKKGSIIRV